HDLGTVLRRKGRPRRSRHELLRGERARAGEHRQSAEELTAAATAQPFVPTHQAQRRLTRIDRLLRITFAVVRSRGHSRLRSRAQSVAVAVTWTPSPTRLTACTLSTPAG